MPTLFCGSTAGPHEGRFAIVVSRYHQAVTDRLLQGALDTWRAQGVPEEAVHVACVPGAWEIPLVAQRLARSGVYRAIVCLGAVVRGETTHDQHINRQVSAALGTIAREFNLPVLFGVLTCQTMEQALQRAGGNVGNKGSECALAALEMSSLMQALP